MTCDQKKTGENISQGIKYIIKLVKSDGIIFFFAIMARLLHNTRLVDKTI